MKYLANSTSLLKAAVFCGATLLLGAGAQAQEATKIGYVNAPRIWKEALPFKAASAKLEQDFGKRVAELHDMEARLKAMQAKLEKDAPIMSEADRNKDQHDLIELNKEFQRKQRELQEDVSQRQNEERENLSERASKVIAQIAQDEKYDIVIQDAAYHSPRVDITDKVLKVLNKQ